MRIRGFVSVDKAEKEGFLFNLRDEIGIIGDWVLDKDTGTIVKKGRYYVPGPIVGVNTGRKGVSLSHIEHLTPQGEGEPNPKDGDLSELWVEAQTVDSLWHEARNHKCGVFVWSKCQDTKHCGTRVISRVPCKREWCPYCGREQSYFHLIYYYKMLNYALAMFFKNGGKIGYLVVTTTPELREQFLEDPDKMHKFRADVKDYLKDELGYKYGIWRWHFAGDDGRTWYPHLNILLPEGYMDEKKLNRFKRWIERKYGVKVVNYEWTEDVGKLNHWVRYIARPTWNLQNEADPEKFKGMRKFGVWGNKHFKDLGLTEEEVFFLALTIVVALDDLKQALRELETEKLEKLKNLERLLKHMLDDEDLVIPTDQVRDLTLVLHLLRLGRCVRCGGKVKWDFVGFSGWGVLQGLRVGELHRISWNTWIYVPKETPPPEEEVLEEE